MSVRRLAEDQVQPSGFAFNDANAVWASATINKYPESRQQSAVIPLLMRAQEQDGWVTRAAIEHIADMLAMPYIRVLEVATFYTQFQLKPVGTRAHIQVCGTTPCMLRGSDDLIKVCKSKIHADPLHLNAEGTLSWEEVECQGACVNAPMVIIFKDAYEDLTPAQLEHIIDTFEAGKGDEITPGPQIDRVFSAPVGGPLTLLEETVPVRTNLEPPAPEPEVAASVPPSNAGRPTTSAPETDPSLKNPTNDKAKAADNTKAAIKDTTTDAGKTATPAPEATAAVAAEAPGKPAAASETGAAPAAKAAAVAKPSLDDADRPQGIDKPATADDLKMISGVGPKIEGTLHELGIFTFAQIAAWTEAQSTWVDGYLNFKGRIGRDDWLHQAKVLAEGGEAEYIRVFGKKPR